MGSDAPVRVRLRAEAERRFDGALQVDAVLAQKGEPVVRGLGRTSTSHAATGSCVSSHPARAFGYASAYATYGFRSSTGEPSSTSRCRTCTTQPIDPLDLHRAQADRVRSVRRPRREDAPLGLASRGQHLGLPPALLVDVPVEHEDHPRVVPRREAFQRVLVAVAREELDAFPWRRARWTLASALPPARRMANARLRWVRTE